MMCGNGVDLHENWMQKDFLFFSSPDISGSKAAAPIFLFFFFFIT